MKKKTMLVVLVILLAAAAAAAVFFVLNAPVSVEYHGSTYTMTSLHEGFAETTYEFKGEDGATVSGVTCADCGCFVVTHSMDGSALTGKITRTGYEYAEGPVSESCGHETSETFTHGDAYLFTRQVYTAKTRNANAGTVWLYIVISAAVALLGVYFIDRRTRFSRPWLSMALMIGGGVLAAATLFDLLMM